MQRHADTDPPGGVPSPAATEIAEGKMGQSPVDPRRAGYLWIWALVAGLAAGVGAWLAGEGSLEYFQPSAAAAKNLNDPGPLRRELAVIVPRNVAIAYGSLGLLLGATMGLAGGLARRAAVAGLVASIAGAFIAGVVGVGLSFLLVPIFLASYDSAQPSLLLMIAVRGTLWAAIGAASGFAMALGSKSPRIRMSIGGLMGGVAGILVFEIANALVNALDRNDQLIPATSTARLLAYLTAALAPALGAALASRVPSRPVSAIASDRNPVAIS